MSSTTHSSHAQPQALPPEQSGIEPTSAALSPTALSPTALSPPAPKPESPKPESPKSESPKPEISQIGLTAANPQSGSTKSASSGQNPVSTLGKPPRPNPNQPKPPQARLTPQTAAVSKQSQENQSISPAQSGESKSLQSPSTLPESIQPAPPRSPQTESKSLTTGSQSTQSGSVSTDGAVSVVSMPNHEGAKPSSAVHVIYTPKARWRWRLRGWMFAGAIALVSLCVVLLHVLLPRGIPQLTTAPLPFEVPVPFKAPLTATPGLTSPGLLKWVKPVETPKVIPTLVPVTPETSRVVAQPAPGYGHFLYREATPGQLMIVSSYAQEIERLNEEAGLALLNMMDAARQDGVWLVPISGFRDFARQEALFQNQVAQVGSPRLAARSVAPAGYSEHHTGYAVDLADGLARAMDLSLAFGNTPAFEWLTRHANDFGFELSFPENNGQGVMYEPWHWRFVGSPRATQIFTQARLDKT